jgi:hypothetical protein
MLAITTFPKCLDEATKNRVLSGTLKLRKDGAYVNVRAVTLVAGGNDFECVRSESASNPENVTMECTASEGNTFFYLLGHDADIQDGLGIVGSAVVSFRCSDTGAGPDF